jgi:hypothetical protein
LPEEIVWKRKKAIQHGTGVENAIRRVAKGEGLDATSYLVNIAKEICQMETMPRLSETNNR